MTRHATAAGPDREDAIVQYRATASGYDRHMRRFARWQRLAVDRLELRPGGVVIDVACGTGLNFPMIEEQIGADGRIIGIDLSPDMIAQARQRATDEDWNNVTLIESAVEDAEIGAQADAALFSFTHDVLQSPRAVANVIDHLRPGATVASVGAKLGARWNVVVNSFVRLSARPYVTTFEGLDRPWREVERYAGSMEHKNLAFGGAYVAWGTMGTATRA
jgi:SAM-dependent methyltransferase